MVSNMLVDSFWVNVDNMVYRMPSEQMLNVLAVFCKQFDTNPQCINCFAKMVSEAATLAVFQQVNVDLCRYMCVLCVLYVYTT